VPDLPPRTPEERGLDSRTLEYIRRRAAVREVSDRQKLAADAEESGWLEDALKIGGLAAGAWFLGKRVIADDYVLRGIHHTGQFAKRAVGKPVAEFYQGLKEYYLGSASATARSKSVELVDDFTQAWKLVQQVETETGKTYTRGNAAHQRELFKMVRRGLKDEGYENLDRAGLSSLRPATVGDIMRDLSLPRQQQSNHFKVMRRQLGDWNVAAIEKGVETGILHEGQALTRGHGGLFIDLAGDIPGFVDTRFMKPTTIARSAYNVLSGLRVPFTGFRPIDLIANPLRRLGRGEFAGRVGSDINIAPGVRTSADINFVVGKRLYAQVPGRPSFTQVGENVALHRMSGVGRARLERYGNLEGKLAPDLARAVEQGTATLRQKAQYYTGVGREFRTSESVLRQAWDTLRRRDAVIKGAAGVELFESAPRGSLFGVGGRNIGTRYAAHQRETAQLIAGRHPIQAGAPRFWKGTTTAPGGLTAPVDSALAFDFASEGIGNPEILSLAEKIKIYAGKSDRGAIARARTHLDEPLDERLAFESTDATVASLQGRRASVPSLDPLRPGKTGIRAADHKTATSPIEFFAAQGTGATMQARIAGTAEAVTDIGNFMTSRLNDLLGWTTGVGFRPTVGKGVVGGLGATAGNVAKLYGLNEAFHATLGYANYADYLFESTIGMVLPEGYDSPKKLAIRMYQGFQLARAYVRDAIGITGSFKGMEDLFPGMIESGVSWTGRTVAPVVAGGALGGFAGAAAGLATSLLVGGSDSTTTAEETLAEFKGQKLVPIRKSRWWMLGRQPFEGGQIDHFAPHWTRRALSDYRFTESQYGSKGEYYSSVSRLPTLHNLFGIKGVFQEGGIVHGGDVHLAKKHARTRPYPNTPGIDYEKMVRMAQILSSKGPYDAPIGAGQRLGYGAIGQSAPLKEEGMVGGIRRFGDKISELGGIYKFLFSDLPGDGTDGEFKLAKHSLIDSRSRAFYDASLGGMGGMTELYRRFVPTQDSKQGYNPVPNAMPDWLPGVRSRFRKDQTQPNRFDFTVGDPYARVSGGEYRLPGKGYEALHRLHSGTPGIYDPMDRFMILSDVAPSSEAYKHYKTIVEGWQKSGVLDVHWSEKFQTTTTQVKQKMERYKFAHRRFTGTITDPDPEGTEKRYNALEKVAGGLWEVATHDLAPRVGDVVPLIGPLIAEKGGLQQLSPIEHYQRYQVQGEEFADWRSPYKAFVRHKYFNATAGDPFTAAASGATAGYLLGSNPIAGALMGTVSGAIFGGGSVARQISGTEVPGFRQREYEMKEWFDNFAYTKSRVLESRAQAMEDPALAEYYRDAKRRTVAGLNFSERSSWAFTAQALKAMDRNNRAYFLHFLDMPEEAQREVTPYMPRHLKPVMARATEQGDRLFSGYRKMARMSADKRAGMYFSQTGSLPQASWAGWHPDVPMDAIKIKFIDSGVNSVAADIHKFDLFAEHRVRAAAFDNLPIPVGDLSGFDMDPSMSVDLQKELADAGFQNVRFGFGTGPSHGVNWNMTRDTFSRMRAGIGEALR